MREWAWKAFAVLMGPLVIAFLLADDLRTLDALWIAISVASVAGVAVGIRLHRPQPASPWWLLSASFLCFAVVFVFAPSSAALSPGEAQQVVSEVLQLIGYGLLGTVALFLVRFQTPRGDRAGIIDGFIVMIALTTVLWTVLFDSITADIGITERLVYVVAPLVPAGVAAICVRLMLTSGGRVASATLLASGGFLSFAGNLTWILGLEAGTYQPGGWIDLLFVLAMVCAVLSALHPSMARLTQPAERAHDAIGAGRLAVLGLALVTTPAALLYAVDDIHVHVAVPVTGSAMLALFVLVRLGNLVHAREQARREVETRESHQAAVSALAAEALTDRAVSELYELAATLATSVLDGVEVIAAVGEPGERGPVPAPEGVRIIGLDGQVATLDIRRTAPRTLTSEEHGFLVALGNVLSAAVQRRQAEDALRKRALHDDLTGLPNRALLFGHLGLVLARRRSEEVGVVYIDLDGFKAVNDTHGHEAGDRLLIEIAQRMRDAVRAGDIVARLAGDEFVVVAEPTDEQTLAALAGRLLAATRQPIDLGSVHVQVGASIGAVLVGLEGHDPDAVLRAADAAMYRAKRLGGGQIALGAVEVPAP